MAPFRRCGLLPSTATTKCHSLSTLRSPHCRHRLAIAQRLVPRFRMREEEGSDEDVVPRAPPAPPSDVRGILATSSVDDILRSAHVVLSSAERRIGDYCSTFAATPHTDRDASPLVGSTISTTATTTTTTDRSDRNDDSASEAEGGGDVAETRRRKCWHIYRSFGQAARRLEAAAAAEAASRGGRPGPACADVESLEKLVRELEYVPAGDMMRVLAANEKLLGSVAGVERRRKQAVVDAAAAAAVAAAAGTAVAAEGTAAAGGAASTAAVDSGGGRPEVVPGLDRRRAEAVFRRLDRQRRGWLDRDDLLAGLELLGEHLDPSDVEQVCLELGGSGRVDLQTFCDIAAAERLVVPGSDAVFLRHLSHSRPEWWSEMPHFLDNSM